MLSSELSPLGSCDFPTPAVSVLADAAELLGPAFSWPVESELAPESSLDAHGERLARALTGCSVRALSKALHPLP